MDKFQADLGLTDEDVTRIKQPIIERRTAEHQEQQLAKQRQQDAENRRQQQEAERLQAERQREQEYQQQLKRYEQEFSRAIRSSFPVDSNVREGLKNFQQALNLKDEDIAMLEAPLLKAREAEYQKQQAEKLRQQQEAERLQQQETERLGEQQRRQQKEESDRQQAALLKQQEIEQQRNLEARSNHHPRKRKSKLPIFLGIIGVIIIGIVIFKWYNEFIPIECVCKRPQGCTSSNYTSPDGRPENTQGERTSGGYTRGSLEAGRRFLAVYESSGYVCSGPRP